MNRTKVWLAAAVCAPLAIGAAPRAADEDREPPSLYTVRVGTKDVPIRLDQPVDIELNGAKTRLLLRVKPHRVLDVGTVRFHYPRAMAFEVQAVAPSSKLWTLDGNDAVVMLQRSRAADVDAARDAVTDEMVARWGENLDSRAAHDVTLARRTIAGERFRITVAGRTIEQSVYTFGAKDDVFTLILQDSLTDDGERSREAARVFRMVCETFAFTPVVR